PNLLTFCFLKGTPPTHIYTLSLHDALPISSGQRLHRRAGPRRGPSDGASGRAGSRPPAPHRARAVDRCDWRTAPARASGRWLARDRKSTRLNSSHLGISYAVFCLKKKKVCSDNFPAIQYRISPGLFFQSSKYTIIPNPPPPISSLNIPTNKPTSYYLNHIIDQH